MNKKIIIIFIFLTIFFSSCDKSNINNTGDNDFNEIKENVTAPFTLVLNYNGYSVDDYTKDIDKYIEIIEEQIYKEGFNIDIDVYVSDKNSTISYKLYLKSILNSNKNVIFSGSGLSNYELETMQGAGDIKEISDEYTKYAPYHYINTYGNDSNMLYYKSYNKYLLDDDDIYGIPVGSDMYANYSALLVKADVAKEYNKNIKTIEDYENLLEWIANNKPQYEPGLFPLKYVSPYGGTCSVYEFLAEYNGYVDINYLLDMGLPSGFCYINSTKNYDVINITRIPDFIKYMNKIKDLSQKGYVDLWKSSQNSIVDSGRYASIVTNIFYYINPYTAEYLNDYKDNLFVNAKGYYMYILNRENMYNSLNKNIVPIKRAMYISGNSENPEAVFTFIDWLYSKQENYNLFMLGREGKDYEIKNNLITYLEDGRTNFSKYLFKDFTDYHFERFHPYCPDNWDEILNLIDEMPVRNDNSLKALLFEKKGLNYKETELENKYTDYGLNSLSLSAIQLTTAFFNEYFFNANENEDFDNILEKYITNINNDASLQNIEEGYNKFLDDIDNILNR